MTSWWSLCAFIKSGCEEAMASVYWANVVVAACGLGVCQIADSAVLLQHSHNYSHHQHDGHALGRSLLFNYQQIATCIKHNNVRDARQMPMSPQSAPPQLYRNTGMALHAFHFIPEQLARHTGVVLHAFHCISSISVSDDVGL
jgi:hypothetical protein